VKPQKQLCGYFLRQGLETHKFVTHWCPAENGCATHNWPNWLILWTWLTSL